jgi:hypothetical protein
VVEHLLALPLLKPYPPPNPTGGPMAARFYSAAGANTDGIL